MEMNKNMKYFSESIDEALVRGNEAGLCHALRRYI